MTALKKLMKAEKGVVLIDKYIQELTLNGAAKNTLTQSRPILIRLNAFKPIEKCTANDIKAYLELLQKTGIGLNTQAFYKGRIKAFFIWNQKPEVISWIKIKKEKGKVNASDLITSAELEAMLKAAYHPRDKCYISLLSETGARPSELLALNIGDVQATDYGMEVRIPDKSEGQERGAGCKTGYRSIPIIDSVGHVKMWLNQYPGGTAPERPLFVSFDRVKQFGRLGYRGIEYRVRHIAKAAGITRRIHCYLFRHTMLTDMVKQSYNESIIRKKAGWSPSSKMIETYLHTTDDDVKNATLAKHGLRHIQQAAPSINLTKECPTCHKQIPVDSQFCENCSKHQDLSPVVKQMITENKDLNTRLDSIEKKFLVANQDAATRMNSLEEKHQSYQNLVNKIIEYPHAIPMIIDELKKYEESEQRNKSEYNARVHKKNHS